MTGNACRFKVCGWLKKRFTSPKDAERFYWSTPDPTTLPDLNRTVSDKEVQTDSPPSQVTDCSIQSLSLLFSSACKKEYGLDVPEDFLVLSSRGMLHLHLNQRSNVLYTLAKGLGVFREDGSDSRFPVKRMPMGLLEYISNFFIADTINQVYY